MSKQKLMEFSKKMFVGFLTAAVVVSGIIIMPTVNAADEAGTVTMSNGIKYVPYDMEQYWTSTKKTAPEMDGYVFGGWYKTVENSKDEFVALKESEIKAEDMKDTYAKFVSAYVLSIKAQIDVTTQEEKDQRSEKASLRVISSVDSTDYQKVGFEVLLSNIKPLYKDENNSPLETTKIYSGLKRTTDEKEEATLPSKLFGDQSAYLSVWRLDGIGVVDDKKIINVTPYWITMDGTKVEGLTKYVHVEDGYNEYISIPINLREAKEVAAGSLTLTYPEGLEYFDAEYDGVFKEAEMKCHADNTTHTVKIVGNAETVDSDVKANGIYANIRFKKVTGSTYESGKGEFLEFSVIDEKFCNWDEEIVAVDAWDIRY